MVSSVERAPVCRAGGRGLKPRPGQHSIRYSHFAVSTPLGTKRTVSEEGMPHGQLLNASLTRRFCPLGDEVHYNPFASINRPPASVSMNALLSSLRFSFHMQSFADVLFSLQPPQLCLLSLVYNQFCAGANLIFLSVFPYVYNVFQQGTMLSLSPCLIVQFLQCTMSSSKEPISFTELLFYAVS